MNPQKLEAQAGGGCGALLPTAGGAAAPRAAASSGGRGAGGARAEPGQCQPAKAGQSISSPAQAV